jgi:glutamyl-tRNA synthetase
MGVRFAPSPTGAFHIGNLRTAWISFWWAQKLKLPWVVRFEEIDRPRVIYGAQEGQLADMKALGLSPDELVLQSTKTERHWKLFVQAKDQGAVYPCFCSRKEVLEQIASAPHQGTPPYSGRCRSLDSAEWAERSAQLARPSIAWRFKMPDSNGTADFVVARTPTHDRFELKDFVPAYQWACAIDDIDGGYDLLVRAFDLKDSAPQQRAIQRWLVGDTVRYPAIFHTSLVVNNDLSRLEKRTRGVTLAEVLAAGQKPERLVELFAKSFHSKETDFSPSVIFGESDPTITLAQLGL